MRKSLLLVISILACFMAFSQNTSPVLVKDFVQVTTEKIDKEGVPKQNWTDNDNNPICLIKVKASGFESSLMQKFMFVPNGLEITYMTQKNDQWYPLEAHAGVPAAKIAVKPTYEWCDEFESIEVRYPKFKDWVHNKDVIWY